MTDLSVVRLAGFVAGLATQLSRGDAELADQRCGEGALRGVADPGGDLAHRQAALQQQFVGLVQASAARVVHGRLSGLGEEQAVEARHRKTGQPRQVGYL